MIKLLIGGSPCTYWSIAQKNNREMTAEGLGWELFKNYLIAKEKFKPDFFLYENNKSAAQAIKDQIKKELNVWDGTLLMEDSGARYIEINSALVSAQNRQRFYVHNCGEVGQPEDRGILLRDILESGIGWTDKSYAITTRDSGAISEDTLKRKRHAMVAEPIRIPSYGNDDKSRPIRASYAYKGAGVGSLQSECFPDNPNKQVSDYIVEPVRVRALPRPNGELSTSQGMRVYSVDGKSVTQSAGGGGMGGKTGLYAIPFEQPENYLGEKMVGYVYKEGTKNFKQRVKYVETVECEITTDGTKKNAKPIYEVKGGLIIIKGKQYPIKLADGFYIIRKLTVTECARLQTMPEIVHELYINLNTMEMKAQKCLDYQNTNALYAGGKCHKSQKLAGNAVSIDLLEFAQFVESNTSIKHLLTNGLALLNVHTNCVGLNNQKGYSRVSPKNASNVEKSLGCLCQEQTEIFAQAIVGITTMLRKIMQAGVVELHQNGKTFAVVENGKVQFMMCGTEIMQLVKDADCTISKVTKAITSTTLEVLPDIKTCGQILTTLFCYVLNAIGGFILQKTNGEILFQIKTPYTYAVSDTQAYKGLGNGWTAEVIIHILNGALKNVPKDEEIIVLSMYDGIGTGRYCLDKMGFTNVKYYAYEIDKYAKQIAMSNYPDIIQMGDAFALRNDKWSL